MKHLKLFNDTTSYNAWKTGDEFILPNVSYVKEINSVKYEKGEIVEMQSNGAYIQHIDGTLYTGDQWITNGYDNSVANGIGVKTPKVQVVISKNDLGVHKWSNITNEVIAGVTTASYGETDIIDNDFNGIENTEKIVAVSTSGAAIECANYTFPNGAKGYLPGMGEWKEVYAYKNEIEELLTLIGGDMFNKTKYLLWSSTQMAYAMSAWGFDITNSNRSMSTKVDELAVRAFTTLII